MKKIIPEVLKFTLLIPAFLLMMQSCQENEPGTKPTDNTDTTDTLPEVPAFDIHTGWTYNLTMYEVNIRQYTSEGTFSAFESHLPRLKEMGLGILWLMPINPIGGTNRLGSLGSYYSVKDYEDINPEFGSMADFKSLVEKIHAQGMYVIIDWVANHTSWDNVLTTTNPEFYVTDGNGNFIAPPGTNWSDVIELDYSNPDLESYMIETLKHWVSQTGIDGFRFDAVDYVPDTFWKKATTALKAQKPDILLLAEGDNSNYYSLGFDMDYCWSYCGWGNGLSKKIYEGSATVAFFNSFFNTEISKIDTGYYRMYFTTSHDENSWYGTSREQLGESEELFAVFAQTFSGMPMIYSGQEAGLNHRLQFFDKDLISWENLAMQDIYGPLIKLKRENKALWSGTEGGRLVRIKTSDDSSIFSFYREKDSDKVLVMLNMSSSDKSFSIIAPKAYDNYTNVYSGAAVPVAENSTFTLEPWSYIVLKK